MLSKSKREKGFTLYDFVVVIILFCAIVSLFRVILRNCNELDFQFNKINSEFPQMRIEYPEDMAEFVRFTGSTSMQYKTCSNEMKYVNFGWVIMECKKNNLEVIERYLKINVIEIIWCKSLDK